MLDRKATIPRRDAGRSEHSTTASGCWRSTTSSSARASHVSARYTLEVNSQQRAAVVQRRAGFDRRGLDRLAVVAVQHDAAGFCRFAGGNEPQPVTLRWEDRRLVWAVREPFRSRHSSADLVAGFLDDSDELVVGSQMPTGGVIFSEMGIKSSLRFGHSWLSWHGQKLVVG